MPVGTQLLPHRELATSYGVSIITINKALSGLVSEGILHSRVGRGTFVAMRPAQSEQARAPQTLGFVLRDLGSPFFSLVAHAAEQKVDALGYGLLFSSSANRIDREEEQIRRFTDLGVSGLIIASMGRTYRLSDQIQALHDQRFPYAMVSYTAGDNVPFIGMDGEAGGYLAASHLIGNGRRRIGYIGDKFGSVTGGQRGVGYRRALHESGLEVTPEIQFAYPYEGEWNDYRSGYAIGERVARMSDRPDAMFVFNDLGAIGFQDAVLDAGLRVPDDIAIVGLDDIEVAARARVPLTTVRQPVARIGELAAESVITQIRTGRPAVRTILAPQLVVRRSSGAAGTESSNNPELPASPFAPLPATAMRES